MNENALARTFDTSSLVKYVFSTIVMMIFMSSYSIIDGVFVARFVNEDALSAINLVVPVMSFVWALALMFGVGGNAVIAKLMGEGKTLEAKQFFTVIYMTGTIIGIVFTILTTILSEPILQMLGANETLYPYAKDYLMCVSLFLVTYFWQVFTQSFFVTASKPQLGFIACLLGGVANIILDYIFIVELDMGIAGAGLATGIGALIPGLYGFLYFLCNKKSTLHFVVPKLELSLLLKSMGNGASEFVGSTAMSITTLLFNTILLTLVGNDGVAAISVILYIQMIQTAVYTGYSFGVSPIISYKYGAEDHEQLQTIVKISFKVISVASLVTLVLTTVFAEQAVSLFIDRSSSTFEMTVLGLRLYSIAYLFMGYNVFASALFTALSNGRVSAFLSISRTFVILVVALITLPMLFGINGVWLAVPVAEVLALVVAYYFFKRYKSYYNY